MNPLLATLAVLGLNIIFVQNTNDHIETESLAVRVDILAKGWYSCLVIWFKKQAVSGIDEELK